MMSSFMKLFNKPGRSKRTLNQVLPSVPEDSDDQSSFTSLPGGSSQVKRKSIPQKPEWMSCNTLQLLMVGKECPRGAAHSSSTPSPEYRHLLECSEEQEGNAWRETPQFSSRVHTSSANPHHGPCSESESSSSRVARLMPEVLRASHSSSSPAERQMHPQQSGNSSNQEAEASTKDLLQPSRREMQAYANEIKAMMLKNNISPPWEEKKDEEEQNAYKRKLDLLEFRLSEWQVYREMSIDRKNRLRCFLGLEVL
eukprot:TRINITY_DN40751_c0_g1_i1.p1 TRINITY_DN40751_c0_g1~~TRINITY_DN40751_c0_g1_i1.p1  ORF type:complete len:281 (-),score=44.05 TRINITY_DN40751_c0_g1_i1:86-847(-)